MDQLDAEVGGTVEVRGEDYTVVGILERTLTAPDKAVVMTLEDAQQILLNDMPEAVRDQVTVTSGGMVSCTMTAMTAS